MLDGLDMFSIANDFLWLNDVRYNYVGALVKIDIRQRFMSLVIGIN